MGVLKTNAKKLGKKKTITVLLAGGNQFALGREVLLFRPDPLRAVLGTPQGIVGFVTKSAKLMDAVVANCKELPPGSSSSGAGSLVASLKRGVQKGVSAVSGAVSGAIQWGGKGLKLVADDEEAIDRGVDRASSTTKVVGDKTVAVSWSAIEAAARATESMREAMSEKKKGKKAAAGGDKSTEIADQLYHFGDLLDGVEVKVPKAKKK